MAAKKKTTKKKTTKKPATKKPSKATKKPAKKRGRPAQGDKSKRSGVYVRLEEDQHRALEAYCEDLSEERLAKGLKKMPVSTWLRELALKHSGNEALGAAARLRAEAAAASEL